MTTCVKVNDVVAVDTRLTAGGELVDDDFEKVIVLPEPGILLACSGEVWAFEKLGGLAWEKKDFSKGVWTWGRGEKLLARKSDFLVVHMATGKTFVNAEGSLDICSKVTCIGSGSSYAIGAVRAAQALCQELNDADLARIGVETAMKCDTKTGGRVRVWNARTGEEIE